MNEELMNVLLTALGAVLTGLIGYLFMLLRAYTLPKIKNEEMKAIALIGINVVNTAVADVAENFVKGLKNDGKFTKVEAKQALDMTKTKALAQINTEGRALIEKHFGDINVWLEQQIESILSHN